MLTLGIVTIDPTGVGLEQKLNRAQLWHTDVLNRYSFEMHT
jgi:hypothetical protein